MNQNFGQKLIKLSKDKNLKDKNIKPVSSHIVSTKTSKKKVKVF